MRLSIVGGLAGVKQYDQFQQPFWTERIAALSGGRIKATINPFDRAGLRGQDMLGLLKLGVAPFATILLAMADADDPELAGVDLAALNPDIATLRQSIANYRPHLTAILAERYDAHLLGVYAYPAQVLFCAKPFRGLSDLAGRRIRTSSVSLAELIEGVGATAINTPFAHIINAFRDDVIDCAVTGTLSALRSACPRRRHICTPWPELGRLGLRREPAGLGRHPARFAQAARKRPWPNWKAKSSTARDRTPWPASSVAAAAPHARTRAQAA